jgi:hypothetical protein
MKWLSKEKKLDTTLVRLAEVINRSNSSNLVSPVDSTFYLTPLPFYTDFKLYTFVDLSFTPCFEMCLLDNGIYTFILDGTQKPFLEANVVSPLVLTSKNVYQYAMLVLGSIQKNDNSYRLVKSIDEINFSSEPTKEQYQLLESSIKTTKIKKDKDSFLIKTTILYDDSVIEASINVALDGRVEIIKEKKLLDNMPIRELILE